MWDVGIDLSTISFQTPGCSMDCVCNCVWVHPVWSTTSKTAVGRVFSDYLCDGASYSYHLTVREGRRYPETPTHNLSCLNVPSFGIAVGGWKCGLAASLQMMRTNTKNTLLVFFSLSNLFSLVLLSALCLKIMIKTILFFVFESVFASLHEKVHFWNSLGAYSLAEPCFSQRQ